MCVFLGLSGSFKSKGNKEQRGERPLNEWESPNRRSFAKDLAGVAVVEVQRQMDRRGK